jgi:predicted outer membrane repeat protein
MLTNVTFSGNSGYSGGAMFNENGSPTLTNVTFSGNSASYSGGAMFNDNGSPALTNVILWHDSLSGTGGGGAEIFNANSTPVIDHSIVQGSGGSASWDNGLGIDGGGNLDADPKLGALANNGGFTSTLLPDADGAAIDMGVCHVDDPKVSTVDQRGMVRPQPYPNGACDIGSVEAGDVSDRIFANGFNGLSSG